ncbi:unnamed protein product [Schistosoma turkestanicum]|nr:unnamed protein product [Schistosoma turkestanicum]
MSEQKENFFKHPRRKTVYVASRYLEKANAIHRSASSVREKPNKGQQNSLIGKQQSSPKLGANASNARLVIDDSVASAIHPHDMGHSSLTEHSSETHDLSAISSSSLLPVDNPMKKINDLDVDSLSDISLAVYSIWTLFQRYASNYIVNKVECDYVKIVDLLNRIKSKREEIIRLRKLKCEWENWYQSVKDLHNERKLLTNLIQTLGISENNSTEKDNSLNSQIELLPQLEQSILQKFSPVFNRLIVKGIKLDNCENVLNDLKQLNDIASLFSNINENDINSFEQLANEIHNFADHLQTVIYPNNITQYEQLIQCLQTFILQTSLKCEQIERQWLKQTMSSD